MNGNPLFSAVTLLLSPPRQSQKVYRGLCFGVIYQTKPESVFTASCENPKPFWCQPGEWCVERWPWDGCVRESSRMDRGPMNGACAHHKTLEVQCT